MKTIPRATPIALTADERRELDALAGSRKSEVRMRERARIVLLAAGGLGSRAIGRAVGCTPGTASMISPTRLSRQLRRMLDLGVIKRVTGTYRYYLTKAGRAATAAAERITEAVIVPAMI